jgi:hypothetical protein
MRFHPVSLSTEFHRVLWFLVAKVNIDQICDILCPEVVQFRSSLQLLAGPTGPGSSMSRMRKWSHHVEPGVAEADSDKQALEAASYETVSIENCRQDTVKEIYSKSRGCDAKSHRYFLEPGSWRRPIRNEIWSNKKTACSRGPHEFQRLRMRFYPSASLSVRRSTTIWACLVRSYGYQLT